MEGIVSRFECDTNEETGDCFHEEVYVTQECNKVDLCEVHVFQHLM